jgi:hypothetical protein
METGKYVSPTTVPLWRHEVIDETGIAFADYREERGY